MIIDIVALSFCILVFGAFAGGMLLLRFRGPDNVPDLLRLRDRAQRGLLVFRLGGAGSFLALGISMLLILLSKLVRRSAIGRVGAYVGIVGVVALFASLIYMETRIRQRRRGQGTRTEDDTQKEVV